MLVGGMGGSDRALRSMPLTERYSDCFSFVRETIPGNLFHFPVAVKKKKQDFNAKLCGKERLESDTLRMQSRGRDQSKSWLVVCFQVHTELPFLTSPAHL